jgi:hypothetical protein
MDLETQLSGVVMMGCMIGFAIVFVTTMTVFPISYMMNKYIYHATGIRILVAVAGLLFGVLVFVYAIVMSVLYGSNVYYFGLFPLYIPMESEQSGGGEEEGEEVGPAETWLTRMYKILLQLSSPLSILADIFRIENYTVPSSNANLAYTGMIKRVYEGNTELPRYDTKFLESMKHAGKASTLDTWMGEMRTLEQTSMYKGIM